MAETTSQGPSSSDDANMAGVEHPNSSGNSAGSESTLTAGDERNPAKSTTAQDDDTASVRDDDDDDEADERQTRRVAQQLQVLLARSPLCLLRGALVLILEDERLHEVIFELERAQFSVDEKRLLCQLVMHFCINSNATDLGPLASNSRSSQSSTPNAGNNISRSGASQLRNAPARTRTATSGSRSVTNINRRPAASLASASAGHVDVALSQILSLMEVAAIAAVARGIQPDTTPLVSTQHQQQQQQQQQPRQPLSRAQSLQPNPSSHAGPSSRSGPRSGNPWLKIVSLESIPALPEFIQLWIARETAHSGKKFIEDRALLQNNLDAYGPAMVGDAFMSSCLYLRHLKLRTVADFYRWTFLMLMFFDVYQLIIPGGGQQVVDVIKEQLEECLKDVLPAFNESKDEMLKQAVSWIHLSRRINMFCEEFGDGVLFHLYGVVSRDWIANKMTMRTPERVEAFSSLHDLEIRQTADRSEANALGSSIRRFLRRPFYVAHERQVADAIAADEMDEN